MKEKNLLISICVVTYNHEEYLRDCLAGIADQLNGVNAEVIVGDDFSTDSTKLIIQEFVSRYPTIFRAIFHSKNIGPHKNFLSVHKSALGDFVFHIDGDDIVFGDKFKTQLNFMLNNPDYAACGHRVKVVDFQGDDTKKIFPAESVINHSKSRHILNGMPFAFSSLMYRRFNIDKHSNDDRSVDWYFVADILNFGLVACLDDVLGAYRLNQQSLSSNLGSSRLKELIVEMYCRQFVAWKVYRREFFCVALLDTLAAIKNGRPVGTQLRRLLAKSFTLSALPILISTYLVRKKNAKLLKR